jgi:hypothetical protein
MSGRCLGSYASKSVATDTYLLSQSNGRLVLLLYVASCMNLVARKCMEKYKEM